MEDARLLIVAYMTLQSAGQIAADLRFARLSHERAAPRGTLLFLCDLPDAPAISLPSDAALIRCVQSGVMSMEARRSGEYLFLVRKRERDDALHLFLGKSQKTSPRQTIHALISGGASPAAEAANFSHGALFRGFDAVLIAVSSLRFTPDTPGRMLAALLESGVSSLSGRLMLPIREEEPLFCRLVRAGFSLLPSVPEQFGPCVQPPAVIYRADALCAPPARAEAEDCVFLASSAPTLNLCFKQAKMTYPHAPLSAALLPLMQSALLFLSALTGQPLPAAIAVVAPEYRCLLRPVLLPGALIRLALLPRHAAVAANALIARKLRGKRWLLTLPQGGGVCVVCGAALLALALMSTHALAALLCVGLLWLSEPAIDRALSLPTRERIPLDVSERTALISLTQRAYASLDPEAASPAHLLAACAGCMLSLLEPDEAARRAESMLPHLVPRSAFDAACILCAAQFFQEQMASCDAALRMLPAALSSLIQTVPKDDGRLCALLCAALEGMTTPDALASMSAAGEGEEMDALFFPCRQMPQSIRFFAVTHPHAFINHYDLSTHQSKCYPRDQKTDSKKSDPPSPQEKANRFLVLACAALNAPFHALLIRSGAVAPYAPLWDLAQQTAKPASRSAATIRPACSRSCVSMVISRIASRMSRSTSVRS